VIELEDLREGLRVKRFHTVDVLREETVGHHSANVCLILMYLYGEGHPRSQLLQAAILHDIAEQWTGDLPAMIKWKYPQLKELMKVVEAAEWELREEGSPTEKLTNGELLLLQLADSADCGLKCAYEVRMGNTTLGVGVTRIRANMEALYAEGRHHVGEEFHPRMRELINSIM